MVAEAIRNETLTVKNAATSVYSYIESEMLQVELKRDAAVSGRTASVMSQEPTVS